jgi:serine protease inhibitor
MFRAPEATQTARQDPIKQMAPLIEASNHFGFELLIAYDPKIPSPAMCFPNIYHCMLLLAAGSDGTTLDELALKLGLDRSALQESFLNFQALEKYIISCPETELTTSAAVWHQKLLKLEPAYKTLLADIFDSHVGKLAADDINNYVTEKTKGKIKADYSPENLKTVEMMLMTTLYFNAKWMVPFKSSVTKESDFHGFNNKMPCHLMQLQNPFPFYETDDVQICHLPYKTKPQSSQKGVQNIAPHWHAAIILPKQEGPEALQAVLQSFTTPALSSLLNVKAAHGPVLLSLPRFKLELSLELNTKLRHIGLNTMFQTSADFAPMTKSPLQVSVVNHDLFIEVKELGTEMAAVTTVKMRRSAMPPSLTKIMRVDRPFVFITHDSKSGLVLCSVVVAEVPFEKGT